MNAVPVRHDGVGVSTQSLDETENVVPPATVQSSTMLPQLKQDLIHLERSWQSLNQNSCLQGSNSSVKVTFSIYEHTQERATALLDTDPLRAACCT